jgi:hypothetical protein
MMLMLTESTCPSTEALITVEPEAIPVTSPSFVTVAT